MPDVPSRPQLDRQALERVLARAAELQVGSPDAGDASELISEEQIIELGREVGLSPEHLRRALAEERTRVALPTEERGLAATVLGVGRVHAWRDVRGTPVDLLPAVDLWMQREESLMVKRHHPDRVVWEPRRDIFGVLRRAVNIGGRGYPLAAAGEVSATFTALDAGTVRVSLDADLSSNRERLGWSSTAASLVGASGAGVLYLLGMAVPVAVIPALAVPPLSVYLARRIQRRAALRAQLALEQLLDRLERGGMTRPPTLIGAITAVAAAAAAAAVPRRPR